MSLSPDVSVAAASVARQPIYDRRLDVHAYELLVSGGGDHVEALSPDELETMIGGRPVHDAARVVEVDVAGLSREELEERVRAWTPGSAKLLARNVDDYASFELCRELGFDYFQGSFFLRPKAIDGDGVPAARGNKVALMSALQDPDVELEELERVIAHDVGLSYRLLRTINAGYFFVPNRVASIHDALVLLGRKNVRTWATLVLLSDIDDRPSELLVTAMLRARLCELVAEDRRVRHTDSYFTVGLFSVIDAFVDAPLEEILASLPFSEDIVAALLRHEGDLGRVLAGVVAYEGGRFAAAEELLSDVAVRDLYLTALRFADETGRSLAGLR